MIIWLCTISFLLNFYTLRYEWIISILMYLTVFFDEKCGNLCLDLQARWYTISIAQVGCSIFHPSKFEQTITHQHMFLWSESVIDGTAVTIILCLHVLLTHHILINFWICRLFSVNKDVFKTIDNFITWL
jgi:hypothetical protein